jgi:hypothetical protein
MILFPLYASGVIDTGGKFANGINNTSGTSGEHSLANISANFRKNLK